MSKLKQQAVQVIENLQEDVMIQVVAYLKDIEIKSKKDAEKKALEGLETVLEFAGTLPEDFDSSKELELVTAIEPEKFLEKI